MGKTTKDDYAAFDKLVVVIDELSPMNQKFLFDSVTLSHPFLKQAGRFNLVIEIGRCLKKLTRNFFQSQYRINRLVVTQGDLKYSDFSLSEQFTIGANSLSIRAYFIDKNNKRVGVFIKSGIKPYGDLSVTLSINPKDSTDFDMLYHLNKMPSSAFNPYLISYTSFPLDRGTIELEGVWHSG